MASLCEELLQWLLALAWQNCAAALAREEHGHQESLIIGFREQTSEIALPWLLQCPLFGCLSPFTQQIIVPACASKVKGRILPCTSTGCVDVLRSLTSPDAVPTLASSVSDWHSTLSVPNKASADASATPRLRPTLQLDERAPLSLHRLCVPAKMSLGDAFPRALKVFKSGRPARSARRRPNMPM